jgi:D-alanine-D-alanine ligase
VVVKVFVAYNDDLDLKSHLNEFERAGEEEVVSTAEEVAGITGGRLFPVRDVRAAIETLRAERPDVVFNLCEGVAGQPRWEMHFALALEMLGIPFTGADPAAMGICNDKGLTKRLLRTAGVAVPNDAGDRVIVKPSREDAGIGIDETSICDNDRIIEQARHVMKTYRQRALVEEFIDGPEFNQALYFTRSGPVVLPPGEIVFSGRHRVVGWKAKWAEGSEEDQATVSRTAVIDDALRRRIGEICVRAAEVLSVEGYCRMDLRQRPMGDLVIIDINPNPDIGRGTGFRKALEAAGIPFERFVDELMMAAQSRRHP